MILPLKERLKKAASLVGGVSSCKKTGRPPESIVADVGCDHAYLSLYLVLTGRCREAIASDIRPGPLSAASQNIRRYGCEEKIHTLLTDGLAGIEAYSPTDIVICGMGGDTIIAILKDALFVKKQGMRLILQSMTGTAELALYLAAEGFRLTAERYALEGKKSYRILAAVYEGEPYELPADDALTGRLFFEEDREAYREYFQKVIRTIRKKIDGYPNGHPNSRYLCELLSELLKKESALPSLPAVKLPSVHACPDPGVK